MQISDKIDEGSYVSEAAQQFELHGVEAAAQGFEAGIQPTTTPVATPGLPSFSPQPSTATASAVQPEVQAQNGPLPTGHEATASIPSAVSGAFTIAEQTASQLPALSLIHI